MRYDIIITLILVLIHTGLFANETISFTWEGGGHKNFQLTATFNEEYTIDWGDGIVEKMLGNQRDLLRHNYHDDNEYTVIIKSVRDNCFFTDLYIRGSKLIHLDVSKGFSLKNIICSINQLSILDVSNNVNLETLGCDNNKIKKLDLSKNKKLTILNCNGNLLKVLNLNTCEKLHTLYCSNNRLLILEIQKLPYLRTINCSFNHLTSLDVTGSDNLYSLNCQNNKLTNLNIIKNSSIGLDYGNSIRELNCYNNSLKLSDLYKINKVATPFSRIFGRQVLKSILINIGEIVDFSEERKFDGIETSFTITEKGITSSSEKYLISEGKIKFTQEGNYTITFKNSNIKDGNHGGTQGNWQDTVQIEIDIIVKK
ncbi:leucine-rich repeat domain-containing protein [Paenimyroides viscosum]|uniref:Leucine-rich repeat domain-containing protein n=1 Tax=Paenimyroides viscosum TaxID=2488729 RepID=A0A3P1B5E1_9FLAO|nr:hypothetical protein [Paenimyroides viscosum]RRA96258.1 hypothetical protein EG242_03270 [Paenimyroides viscosum]